MNEPAPRFRDAFFEVFESPAPGNHGDPCTVAAESWRCVHSSVQATNVSQVCRASVWQTYHRDPANCADCCGTHAAACD